MDIFLPDLERSFGVLHMNFRAFSFVILVWAFIRQVSKADRMPDMIKPMVGVMMITMLVSSSHYLYTAAEGLVLDIANYIDPYYKHNPLHAISDITETGSGERKGLIKSLFSDGGYQSIALSLGNMAIKLFSLVQIPLLVIQYFLTKLGYLGMPILLTFFMFGSMSSLAMKYFVQILTIMAWPIGFAITNIVTSNILGSFNGEDTNANILGLSSGTVGSEIGAGLLASLMSLVGTLTTPIVMNQIFSSGAGLMSAMGSAAGITKKAVGLGVGGTKMAAAGTAKAGGAIYNDIQSNLRSGAGMSANANGFNTGGPSGGSWSKAAEDRLRTAIKPKPTVSDV